MSPTPTPTPTHPHSPQSRFHLAAFLFGLFLRVKTAGGIILPESAVKRENEGEVLAVGPGAMTDSGSRMDMPVAVGDKVLLPEYGGTMVKMDDGELHLFRADDILGKYE